MLKTVAIKNDFSQENCENISSTKFFKYWLYQCKATCLTTFFFSQYYTQWIALYSEDHCADLYLLFTLLLLRLALCYLMYINASTQLIQIVHLKIDNHCWDSNPRPPIWSEYQANALPSELSMRDSLDGPTLKLV